MEDHSHAYGLWKELAIHGAVCVHVDAHLDVMDRGFSAQVLQAVSLCRSRDELESISPPRFLPWGGVHCGNYLYPALKEGLVSHLIWVVPKPMVGERPILDFAHEELLNWVELTVDEFQGLTSDGSRVEGLLGGQRFTLCTSDSLPDIEEGRPVLLDIDVDYYQTQGDLIWQSPGELKAELALQSWDVLTVAVSVDGGYTLLEHRYLGEVTELLFGGESADWEKRVQAVLKADRHRGESESAYDGLTRGDDPDWFKAALAMKSGLARGLDVERAALPAESLDHRYKVSPFNRALVHFRNKRYGESIALLEEDHDHLFMRGVIALQGGQLELSRESWDEFLGTVELLPGEKAHALFLRAQTWLQLGSIDVALEDLKLATKLDPENCHYLLFFGLAQQSSGDLKKAAKSWRKALHLQGERIASVELHFELARLYRELGRQALADAELQRIRQKDKTGQYKIMIEMERLRSAKRGPSGVHLGDRGLWRKGLNMVGAHG
jgi:tetratricopeptide (TPR) repeat protein